MRLRPRAAAISTIPMVRALLGSRVSCSKAMKRKKSRKRAAIQPTMPSRKRPDQWGCSSRGIPFHKLGSTQALPGVRSDMLPPLLLQPAAGHHRQADGDEGQQQKPFMSGSIHLPRAARITAMRLRHPMASPAMNLWCQRR